MMEGILEIIIGTLLLLCGIQDLRSKRLSLWFILIGAIMVGICAVNSASLSIWDCCGGVAVGALIIGISLLTEGKIGMGDGFLLCVTGIGLGFWTNLELLAFALFAAAIVSIFLLTFRLADRKKSIPFVPFLFLSFLGLIVIPRL